MTQEVLKARMERFTRIAKLLAILVSLAYGYYFVSSVYLLAVGRMRLEALLPGLLLTAFVIGILFLSFRVIFSLRRDCSPFYVGKRQAPARDRSAAHRLRAAAKRPLVGDDGFDGQGAQHRR